MMVWRGTQPVVNKRDKRDKMGGEEGGGGAARWPSLFHLLTPRKNPTQQRFQRFQSSTAGLVRSCAGPTASFLGIFGYSYPDAPNPQPPTPKTRLLWSWSEA